MAILCEQIYTEFPRNFLFPFFKMETPQFEHAPEDHTFQVNDEVYLIDKNEYDIFKARIDKVNKKGFVVKYLEGTDETIKINSSKRILLHTPINDEIYNQQVENRKATAIENTEADKQEESQSDTSNDQSDPIDEPSVEEKQQEEVPEPQNPPKPKKQKKKKIKKSQIFNKSQIVKAAWKHGIHNVLKFQTTAKRNMKVLVSAFEQYQAMMKCSENPPFLLGGNLQETDIKKFWTQALSLWQKQFGDDFSVLTKDFIKKISSAYKLEHQMESNAREALKFFFDSENDESETTFFQFCALLSLFGPVKTMFRKIGHFLQCPKELGDSVSYVDFDDIEAPDNTISVNEFVITDNGKDVSIFNLPNKDTNESYLVDGEGNLFASWKEVFDKFQNKEESFDSSSHQIELEVDE